MKRFPIPPILLLALSGCLSPLTDRLDQVNAQLAVTNQFLASVDGNLEGANQRIGYLQNRTDQLHRDLIATRGEVVRANEAVVRIDESIRVKLDRTNEMVAEMDAELTDVRQDVSTVTGQIVATNEKLDLANEQIDTTNQTLSKVDPQLTVANQQIEQLRALLQVTDRRVQAIVDTLGQIPGLNPRQPR